MKTSISQLKRFTTASCEAMMLLQFAIVAMLCKIITNLGIEYAAAVIIIVCEFLILAANICFMLKFEKAVSNVYTSNNVLTTIANKDSSEDKISFEKLLNMFAASRWISIIIFLSISCFSVILKLSDMCEISMFSVLGLFIIALFDLVVNGLFF